MRLGEEVLNDKGTSSTVTHIQKHENSEIYGFNGEEAFVTKDHPLLVKTDGKNEWKSIDPEWIAPFSHGVDALRLEVGDILLKGENKEEMEVTSIEKEGVVDFTYNLVLDTVHTYYANEYIAHNAFFRSRTLTEERIGGPDDLNPIDWPIDPWPSTGGCPCPDGTTSWSCCKGNPPSPSWPSPGSPGTSTTYKCCVDNNYDASIPNSGIPVGGFAAGVPSGYPGPVCSNPLSLACCIPSSQSCPYGSSTVSTCASQSSGQCEGCCQNELNTLPRLASPQPPEGGGGEPGTGDSKGEIKTQPRPEHTEKMTQWENAVSENAGERVKFDNYGVDANPLFNGDSGEKYEYNIISGDISRFDGDSKIKIGNFMDTEDKSVEVEPIRKPTEKPREVPVAPETQEVPAAPETPETQELKEQLSRIKKLMGM